MNTLFHGCLSRSDLQSVARKQALGFNKAQQLFVCGGGGGGGGREGRCEKDRKKGRLEICEELREGRLFPGTSSTYRLWRMH